MSTQCFWLEPTEVAWRYLRRYTHGDEAAPNPCPLVPGRYSYHNAQARIEDVPLVRDEYRCVHVPASTDVADHLREWAGDPRWPARCECGYQFVLDDKWQLFVQPEYRRIDTNEVTTLRDAVPGAMWDAFWMTGPWYRGTDGLCLVVRTPGGDWMPDSRASNCTMPEDKLDTPERHYCWVRHGDPRVPSSLSVDKNGKTCAAGGGSIQAGNYHGFLSLGVLS